MNILLIDDDYTTNVYHKIILEKSKDACPGMSYDFFECPIKALAHLQKEETKQPCMIFLDINMPIMDGWQFLAEYEQLDVNHAKVIMLSTSLNPLDINKSIENNHVFDFKQKPLTRSILEEVCA